MKRVPRPNAGVLPACDPFASPPKAEEDNPDPSKLTPVAVIGWENLKSRLVGQQREMQKMAEFVAVGGAAAARFRNKGSGSVENTANRPIVPTYTAIRSQCRSCLS